MNPSKSVTFILPVFNGGRYLASALHSLLSQKYLHFRILVLNDGSTDDSLSILSRFNDSRLLVINDDEQRGLSYRLNQGISLVDSDYFARMDQDDVSCLDRLEKQVHFMERNPYLIGSGGNVSYIGSVGRSDFPTCPNQLRSESLFRCSLNHPTMIFRRQMFLDAGFRYEDRGEVIDDYRLWQTILRTHELANLKRVILKYRINPEGMTRRSELDLDRRDLALATAYRENLLFYGIDFPLVCYLWVQSLFRGGAALDNKKLEKIGEIFLFIRDNLDQRRFCVTVMNRLFVELLFYRCRGLNRDDHITYKLVQELTCSIWRFPAYSRLGIRQRMPFKVFSALKYRIR